MALPKFVFSFLAIGILGCLSAENLDLWKITPQPQASGESRFLVLHDWQSTYNREEGVAPFPALGVSDVMLKTMGILRDSASWDGVLMGSLFSRPHATALFIVDGGAVDIPAEHSYQVDQTGMTGCAGRDVSLMFDGDNVVSHLSELFDGKPQTHSVSANHKAAFAASVNGAHTTSVQLSNVLHSLQNDKTFLSEYDLAAADRFDLTSEIDGTFLAELVMMRQTIEQLKEMKAYISDGVPDVYIFTVSTLRSIEVKYGTDSLKMKTATQLVKDAISKVTEDLVQLYDGDILVQALVLEWDYPEYSVESEELMTVYEILQPFTDSTREAFIGQLPNVDLNTKATLSVQYDLCRRVKITLENFEVECPYWVSYGTTRNVRNAVKDDYELGADNGTDIIGGVAEQRTKLFAPIFLIILFITISLGLAVYAVSWMMWNMDPGRDSIIYRSTSDPTEGMRLQ